MKRFLAVALAASLAFGSMGVTAFGSAFADIKSVPWPGAAKFIDEAQSLGLMNGYTEGGKKYCKPKNNVTLCESIQMIYSIMKVHTKKDVSSTDITKWTPVMSAYNIPTWAYNATTYALENQIISNNDLTKLKNGTQNATREEVGVMFGKALASVYTINSNATLSYKDKDKISSSSVPYLALLNSKDIMVGDTENKFNPNSKINRAEMAVLSVKTYNNLMNSNTTTPTNPTSGTVTGSVVNSMILSNGDIFLSVKPNSGSGLNLFGKKGSVKVTYENETVDLKDIGVGDTVTITYSNEDLKTVVINKSDKGINTKKTYPLKGLSTSRITVKDGSKETEYRLDKDVTVMIGDKKSSLSSLKDDMDDYEFTVTLTFDKDNYVTKIEAMRSTNNPLTGNLTYMSNSKVTIEVGSKDYDYPLSDGDVSVKFDGKSVVFSTLLREYKDNNYTVTLKLDSKGYVTNINIDFMEDETHGTLTFMNSYRLELKAGGKTYKYYLGKNVDVEIDGKNSSVSSLMDKYENNPYNISLTVNRDDEVTKISAKTRNASLSKGILKEITSSKIKITVDGKSYEYDLDSPTIKIDGKSVSLTTFRSNYKDYTYEVELKFNSKGEVSDITGKNTKATKGELKNIEPRKEEITIRVNGVDYTYDLDSDVRVTLDGSSSTVSKLDSAFESAHRNDEKIQITLTLNSKDDVTKIVAEYDDATSSKDTAKGILRSLDSWEISIKSGSSTKKYNFTSGDNTITLDGRSSSVSRLQSALDDLGRNEVVSVTLYLNSRDEVTKVVAKIVDESDAEDKPEKGNLTSVATSSGRIIIEDNSNKSYTWYTSSDVRIYYDLSRNYDEDDYKSTLSGLKSLLSDCEKKRDDCYVRLTVNSSGEVTKITAEDR
ncbi:S-layer homology domain-containing protein [Anaerotignum sp.]|uniref:S-layer homology domain-containing protein n=1 Tax=Anaerotignum sp. TaxID=2039241 RepID=UPI0028AAC131|nr:S-layer homology domain-containing protein [Anaerotignum sp.]